MAKKKDSSPKDSSDRKKWHKVFGSVVEMLKAQQSQLQTLLKQRTLLEDRIKSQHRKWESDVNFLKDQISQLKGDITVQEMTRSLDAVKMDLALGLKQREARLCRLKSDQTEGDLADIKECLEFLLQKRGDIKGTSPMTSAETDRRRRSGRHWNKESADGIEELPQNAQLLEEEIRKLKVERDKMIAEKNIEVSALVAEKKFIWKQYDLLEKDLNAKLKNKGSEVELANAKISKLLERMEKLQASNDEKDNEIVKLDSKVRELVATLSKRSDELMRLTRELDSMRNKRIDFATPMSNEGTSRSRSSRFGSENGLIRKCSVVVKKEISSAKVPGPLSNSEKGSRILKRKPVETNTSDVPKLFSSSFKVPKLKNISPYMR